MNLELLQTNLSALIKSRARKGPDDPYFREVEASSNLRLVKKIAFWWRKVQVEQFCALTTNLLKKAGTFEDYLEKFITNNGYSAFREEVGFQFLEYLRSLELDSITRSVVQFEEAIIKKRLGHHIDVRIRWDYEPYAVISGLLHNTFSFHTLEEGRYDVSVSIYDNEGLFHVWEMSDSTGPVDLW
jgi:hypothetical protein